DQQAREEHQHRHPIRREEGADEREELRNLVYTVGDDLGRVVQDDQQNRQAPQYIHPRDATVMALERIAYVGLGLSRCLARGGCFGSSRGGLRWLRRVVWHPVSI